MVMPGAAAEATAATSAGTGDAAASGCVVSGAGGEQAAAANASAMNAY
jgi:hypothetical protein